MTAREFVTFVHARRTGPGRWQARCPAHPDKCPSLSIAEGEDGRVLLHCFAGCALPEILAALGLTLRDLFAGSSATPAQARQAAATRQSYEEAERKQRIAERAVRCRILKLDAVADELISRLANAPDDTPGNDAIAKLFHQTLDKIRLAEAGVRE